MNVTPENAAMLDRIWNEIQYIRARLDSHVEYNERQVGEVKKDLGDLSKEMSGHKVRIGFVITGISLAFTGVVSWLVKHSGGF